MYIDLQLHSTYSDGYYSPTEVVKIIKKYNIKVASLTDHNTVSGLHEFAGACENAGIKAIPGLELYVRDGGSRFNLLWYNFDPANPALHDLLRDSQIRRRRSIRLILNKLVEKGFKFEVNKTLDKYNHYVPINHIISELTLNKGNYRLIQKELNSKNPREEKIIKHYFKNKEYGFLRETYIGFDKIIFLKKKIGGQLILCHPAKYGQLKREKIERLHKRGMDGIEVMSPHHPYGATMFLQQLAHDYDLIETGGSDFHRNEGHDLPLQHAWEYFRIDSEKLKGVEKIIG
jgi:predicted metal-dependent phosphoesterase TrpH